MSLLKTPLGRVRGLGSAKSGVDHWWLQRVTAVANIPLVLFLVLLLIVLNGRDWATMVAAFRHPLVAVLTGLAVLSIFWHMRLGLQVVIEDYVQGAGAKTALSLANTFCVILLGAIALYSILKLSLA